MVPAAPLRVFLCHGRADQETARLVRRHLQSLERRGAISVHMAEDLEAGQDRHEGLAAILGSTDLALLLLSADFLDSHEVQEDLLPSLLAHFERGALRVLKVLLRSCYHEGDDRLLPLPLRPADGLPIESRDAASQDAALSELAHEIAALAAKRLPAIVPGSGEAPGSVLRDPFRQLTLGLEAEAVGRRIRDFGTLYLGTTERPEPFGGRNADLADLLGWLDDPRAPPYLLLTAPAGRGKSALLCHLCARLAQRQGLAVVFFPVSTRFSTNQARDFYAAVLGRLAHLYGDGRRRPEQLTPEDGRLLLAEFLERPLPDGRRLLVVIDGLDEAADWEVDPGLFPQAPGGALKVLVSARLRAGEADARSWRYDLG